MPNIAAADPFAELAAVSAATGCANKISPPPLLPPQRASSLPRSQSLRVGGAAADPAPPLASFAGKTPTFNEHVSTRQTKQESEDGGDLGVGWYDSELQKHKAAAMDATARANALEKRLKEQEEEVREARAAKQKESAVLKELALHFRNSRVLRSEAMVLQYSERLRSSGMEDLGSMLEEVVAREHTVAKMLTDATYLTAMPLKGLIAPPAPPTPRQQQGLNRAGSNLQGQVSTPPLPIQRCSSTPIPQFDHAAVDAFRMPGNPEEYWWSAAGHPGSQATNVPGKHEYQYSDGSNGLGYKATSHQGPSTSRAIHKVAKRLGMK